MFTNHAIKAYPKIIYLSIIYLPKGREIALSCNPSIWEVSSWDDLRAFVY